MEFYIFDTLEEAQSAMDYINNSEWFPADNGQTLRWIDEVTELKDGRFSIPRIPSIRLDKMNVSTSKRNDFRNNHGKKIEEITIDKIKVREDV